MEQTIAKIRGYLKIINKNIDKIDKDNEGLVDLVILEVLDRVQLYLNSETIPIKVERILANIVAGCAPVASCAGIPDTTVGRRPFPPD